MTLPPIEAAWAALFAGAGGMAYAVRSPRCSWLAPTIWHGPRDIQRKAIALTFDDGPSESTPHLLDLLEEYKVRATFFMIGRNVERLPDIAREVLSRGHAIGNHTYSHAPLYLRHPQFIQDEIAAGQEAIHSVTGTSPKWFRPPYGARWFGMRRNTTLMWSTLALDWKLDAPAIAKRLTSDLQPGAIWCLHDGRELAPNPRIDATLDAVKHILPVLRERGYRSLTVSDLLAPLAALQT